MKFPSALHRATLVAALWFAASAVARADFVLVRDGKPVATIVAAVAPAPAEAPRVKGGKIPKSRPVESDEAAAVRTLVDWVKKITDAELPVSTQAPEGAAVIYVGQAAVAAGLKLDDIASPSHEGAHIVVDAKRVLIAGQSSGATLKAVCRFLEELGCRYFMDGPLGEVFPRTRTLAVKNLSITEKPGLIGRNPKGPSWRESLWKSWNGAGGEMLQHSHSWGRYLERDLFDRHPEWFALGPDGERRRGDWLCTSNPDLRQYFATRVIAAIEAGTRHPSISPPDGRGYCQCARCKAQDDPKSIEPSSGTVSVSNRYVDFFDEIGRRVSAKQPDSVLSFYCYADYTQPPTVERKISPNLCAVIAPIRYCRLHELGHPGCPSREQQVAMIDGWARVASRLGYYNYMYNLADGTLPFFKFTACSKEFPYLAAHGNSFMTIEVLSNWHIYGPQIYLSLRLAYDPAADATAIMEDYWQKFYGPRAAPWMKQYWMGIDAAQGRLNSHAGGHFGLAQIYTPEFLKQCAALLAKSADAAKGEPVYEQRVALHTEGFKSAAEYRSICDAMSRGDFSSAKETLNAMEERLRGLASQGWANPEYATVYVARFLAKPVREGAAATAALNRVLQVLPDRWRFRFDETDAGSQNGFHGTAFDDSRWLQVATHSATLDTQMPDRNGVLWYRNRFSAPAKFDRLALFFAEVDGYAEIFVNGKKIAVPAPPAPAKKSPPTTAPGREGQARPRTPFEIDVTAAVKPGDNVLAVRVDHTKITDLSLGGILRPVLLIEKPNPR